MLLEVSDDAADFIKSIALKRTQEFLPGLKAKALDGLDFSEEDLRLIAAHHDTAPHQVRAAMAAKHRDRHLRPSLD